MHPHHRIWLFRAVAVLACAAWAAWLIPDALTLFGAHVEYSWAPSEAWLAQTFGVELEWVDGSRGLVIALLPSAVLGLLHFRRSAGWLRPSLWRPLPLLGAWSLLIALQVGFQLLVRSLGLLGCGGYPGSPCILLTWVVSSSIRAALLGLLLVVLVRRLGPLRSWDLGGLVTVVVAVWCCIIAALPGMEWLAYAYMRPALVSTALKPLHWVVVLAIAAMIWVRLGAGIRHPLGRLVAAVAGAFFLSVLVVGDGLYVLVLTTELLLLTTVLHVLWSWARWSRLEPPRAFPTG